MNRSPSQTRTGSPQRQNRVGSPGIVNFGTSNIAVDTTKVKLNAKGGILVTNAEIENAFGFLDIDKTGKVSLANLKKRLSVFFPEMTGKDYRFLMNGKREMTQHDMMELLSENEIVNFDPVAEAFKVTITKI